jgi:hypothetical protein
VALQELGLRREILASICPYGKPSGEPTGTLSAMREFSADEIEREFLAWQCRIRQIAMREYQGQPTPGMRPRVLRPSGECLVPAMTVLILHEDPDESTVFFRFQVQKTLDPHKVYQSVLSYLQGEYYQESDRFSDEMTALFESDSPTAAKLVKARRCLLEFAQFSQIWRLSCSVRRLPAKAPAREATVWHNRAFNPAVPSDAVVLGFKPAWRSAAASPLPTGV